MSQYSFKFTDDNMNRKLIKLLNKSRIPHSVDDDGVIHYSGDHDEIIENELIKTIRDAKFPMSWQIISCPGNWVERYKEYMMSHDVPFVTELIDGTQCFLLPRRYRPHAWKLEKNEIESKRRIAAG